MLDFSLPILDRLQNSCDPVSNAQLDQLQADLGVAFPDDYRQFLLRYNAGDWAHSVCIHVPGLAPDYDRFHISIHLGLVPNDESWLDDIRAVHEHYADGLPSRHIPVMRGDGGLACMNHDESAHGHLYFWDMGRYCRGEECMFHLADTFTDFLLGLSPDDYTEVFRETLPAFQACERGDKHAVRQFLADGGKVDLRNERGETLTACAAFNSWPKIVGLLLEAGADPNARDGLQRSPLHQAALSSSLDSAKLLLAAGADAHYRDTQGQNLAEIAQEAQQYRMQFFLEPLV